MVHIKITEAQLKKVLSEVLSEQQQPPVQSFVTNKGITYKMPFIKDEDTLKRFRLDAVTVTQMHDLLKQCGLDITSSYNDYRQSYKTGQSTMDPKDATKMANQAFIMFAVTLPRTILDLSARYNFDGRTLLAQRNSLLANIDRMYGTKYNSWLRIYLDDKGLSLENFWSAMGKLVDYQRKAVGTEAQGVMAKT